MRFKTEYADLKWVSQARDLESSRYFMNNILVLNQHLISTDGRRVHIAETSQEFCDWIRENVTGELPETGSDIDQYFFIKFQDKKVKGYANVFAPNILAGQSVYREYPARWPLAGIKDIFAEKFEKSNEIPRINPSFLAEAFKDVNILWSVNENKTMLKIGKDNRLAIIAAIIDNQNNAAKYPSVIDFPSI